MGCFNATGFLSGLPIREGDKAVAIICTINKGYTKETDYCTDLYYTTSQMTPFCLPLYGEYNDYGSLTNIKKNYTAKIFEEMCGDTIENVLKAITLIGQFRPTLAMMLADECHSRDYKNIYEKLHEQLEFNHITPEGEKFYNNYRFVVLFEHQDIYEKTGIKLDKAVKESIDANFNFWKVAKELYGEDILHQSYDNEYLTHGTPGFSQKSNELYLVAMNAFSTEMKIAGFTSEYDDGKHEKNIAIENARARFKTFSDAYHIWQEKESIKQQFFNWKTFEFLPLYEKSYCDPTRIEKSEFSKFWCFDMLLNTLCKSYLSPNKYGQISDISELFEFQDKAKKLYDKLSENHQQEEDDWGEEDDE